MRLTLHTDYALRLLIYLLTHPHRKVSTKEIAAAYGISLHHLTKVAKSLTREGWVLSSKGGGGGLSLAPDTARKRVGDVVRFSETNWDVAECFNPKKNTCPIIAICRLKPVLYRARRAFFDVLDSVTIGEIASNPAELKSILVSPAGS